MTNALSTTTQANGTISATGNVYQKFADPLAAIEKMGNWFHISGMAKNPGEGSVMALACFYRNEDPFKFKRENMIVDGMPVRKYQMLLVDLRNAGGDYEWTQTGEDGKVAILRIHWRGKTHDYTYSMDMAKRAGIVRAGSAWEKNPGNMLRSKAVRHAFDMYCPEIIAGFATPEDVEELGESVDIQPQRPMGIQGAQIAAPEPPPFEIEGELETPETASQNADTNGKTATATKPEVTEPANGKVSRELLGQLVQKARELGLDGPTIKKHICESANVSDPADMTTDQCQELIARVEAKLEGKTAPATVGN